MFRSILLRQLFAHFLHHFGWCMMLSSNTPPTRPIRHNCITNSCYATNTIIRIMQQGIDVMLRIKKMPEDSVQRLNAHFFTSVSSVKTVWLILADYLCGYALSEDRSSGETLYTHTVWSNRVHCPYHQNEMLCNEYLQSDKTTIRELWSYRYRILLVAAQTRIKLDYATMSDSATRSKCW